MSQKLSQRIFGTGILFGGVRVEGGQRLSSGGCWILLAIDRVTSALRRYVIIHEVSYIIFLNV